MPLPNRKRQSLWDDLQEKMSNKRTKAEGMKRAKSSAPHEIIVQKLSSDPDSRQTYRPMQPREFVDFPFEDMTLSNLKSACAAHFNVPATSCDVLVSNKGPSCNNIGQIPHRKDRVYLVRFLHGLEADNAINSSILQVPAFSKSEYGVKHLSNMSTGSTVTMQKNVQLKSELPKSVSISELLRAGKLVTPVKKRQVFLTLESFDIQDQEWKEHTKVECSVDTEKFAEGGFRNAFKCFQLGGSLGCKNWVLKLYKLNAKKTIEEDLHTTIEAHARKQVQMHEVARYLTKKCKVKAGPSFGQAFKYTKVYYTKIDGEPASIEELLPGNFVKYINNNGYCSDIPVHLTNNEKEVYEKAQTLTHFSHQETKGQMMLMDIQGSGFALSDPEIATSVLYDEAVNSEHELLFCCGNLSIVAMNNFAAAHQCNRFCEMLGLQPFSQTDLEYI